MITESPFCRLLVYIQVCVGFVLTNENYPNGCCYLKRAIQTTLQPFYNGVHGAVYTKSISSEWPGTGQQGLSHESWLKSLNCHADLRNPAPLPTLTGFNLLSSRDNPGYDIGGGECGSNLDRCSSLCKDKTECYGFAFNFQNTCCYLKWLVTDKALMDWVGADWGATYVKKSESWGIGGCHFALHLYQSSLQLMRK